MIGQLGYLKFDMREFQRASMNLLSDKNIRRSRLVVKRTVHDLGIEAAKNAQRIVADEVSDSGRLAASIGIYNSGYLKQGGTGSSKRDAHFVEMTVGNKYVVEFGSNVPYATPIMLGFTMNERRVVFSTRLGQFITVHPFSFRGVHAYERGLDQMNSDHMLQQKIFEKNMKILQVGWRIQ